MKGALVAGAILALSALGVAQTQPRLASTAHTVKEQEDVYVLPRPSEFRLADLGYDAAAIDLLWAKLLVDYGTHVIEHREFHPDPYLDTLVAVEPTYEPAYRYADTLLCFRPIRGTEADARKARALLEAGTRALPDDAKVWLQYGQFVAFLGPSFLSSPPEREQWRHDGALAMMRAVDLGADVERALSAATILGKGAERDAAIRELQRAYALTDDPEARRQIELKLGRLEASAQDDARDRAFEATVNAVESRWRERYPFLSRGEFLLVGPAPDAAACAGIEHVDDPTCARHWSAFVETTTSP